MTTTSTPADIPPAEKPLGKERSLPSVPAALAFHWPVPAPTATRFVAKDMRWPQPGLLLSNEISLTHRRRQERQYEPQRKIRVVMSDVEKRERPLVPRRRERQVLGNTGEKQRPKASPCSLCPTPSYVTFRTRSGALSHRVFSSLPSLSPGIGSCSLRAPLSRHPAWHKLAVPDLLPSCG